MATSKPRIVVIGAGAIGASTALHLVERGAHVTVLEKEQEPAVHQSGRNSGVIHAGYNLKPGSAKARFCVEGNRELRDYCRRRDVPLLQNGILVVARDETELGALATLNDQARSNGVRVDLLDQTELRAVEPFAAGVSGLHAPDGASFDPRAYVQALLHDTTAGGGEIEFGVRVWRFGETDRIAVETSAGRLEGDLLVNCAGLQADRLAEQVAPDLRIVPFRGYYATVRPSGAHLVRGHLYAVPDSDMPFLGAHFSRRTDGHLLIGPGAMLAFARENYRSFGLSASDVLSTLSWPGFYRLLARRRMWPLFAREFFKSAFLRCIWAEARRLVPSLQPKDLGRGYAGHRAQVVGRDGSLVDDILIRETPRSLHILNAVSPGLTCSLPFGRHIAERAFAKLA